MKLRLRHHTVFSYEAAPTHWVQRVHLRAQTGPTQRVLHWSLSVPGEVLSSIDGLGNALDTFNARPLSASLSICAQGDVDTQDVSLFDEPGALSPLYFTAGDGLAQSHPRMNAWAHEVVGQGRPDAHRLLALAQAVRERVRYRPGQTAVETDALEAFDWGWGVCQDQAHVMVAVCRGLGWPARYVSGYFHDPHAPNLASHAWVDVCVDLNRQRWVSVDVTHACLSDERHIRLAVGRDYTQCSPTRGVRQGGGREHMDVNISITAI